MKNKKMYCLKIMDDFGELWLGHNKEPIEFIYCDDSVFRKEYQSFIFDYLNVDLISKSIYIDDKKLKQKLWDNSDDPEAIAKLLKKEIDKL